MLRYLLDTNIVTYTMKRRPREVLDVFNKNADRMAISAITLSELIYGAEKSSNVSRNLAAIDDFCCRLEVLPYGCLLYTSPSPRDRQKSRMPSSA